MSTIVITYPSETMFSCELRSNYYFETPVSVSPSGLAMDADRLITLVRSLDGNTEKPKQFMLNAGATGSALEHSVPEQLWSMPENPAHGISAVKALQISNDQGIPIYTINKTNINTVLPQLQIDADDKTDIKNAVNAGKVVTVSKTNITFNGWTGCGYIVIDPKTGAGGYMISGGMSGSLITIEFLKNFFLLLALGIILVGTLIVITALLFTAFMAAFTLIMAMYDFIIANWWWILPIVLAYYECDKMPEPSPESLKEICTFVLWLLNVIWPVAV